MPLDVCAQSMYQAIKAVADKVSNLSLREIHLVNIDPAKTQFIQSVFLQLTSSSGQGSPLYENPPPKKPLPIVTEPEIPSPDEVMSQLSIAVKKENHEELLELHPEIVQASASRTLPDERSTPDVEIVEGHKHALDTAEGSQVSQDEKILDREQTEGQETLDEQCHHSSSDVPETVESFSDRFAEGDMNSELTLDQEDQGSHKLPATDEALSTPDSQSLDVKVGDHEQKSLADSQPSMDKEDEKSAVKIPHSEKVLNTTENDSQTSEKSSSVMDSEIGEMAGDEEHHSLRLELEPQLELCMQELNLEEYHEPTASSCSHELTPQHPLDLPEDVPQKREDSAPQSLESYEPRNSCGAQELFRSLPVNTAGHADHP